MKKLLVVLAAVMFGSVAFAQKYGATPEDSLTCLQNLSVYQEFYKQKNYYDAYDAWKQVVEICPTSSLNNFIRGNAILKTRINKSKSDPEALAAYVDELLNLWDLRAQYFGDAGFCKGMKAKDMLTYKPKQIEEALALYEEAVANPAPKQKTYAQIPYYYFEAVCNAYKKDLKTKEDIMNAYDKAITVLDQISNTRSDDTLPESMANAVTRLFEPYATCEDLVNIYTEKFKTQSEDADFLRKATDMLSNRNCTDNDIFFKMSEALYKVEPSSQSAYAMARMNKSRKQYDEVISYLSDEVLEELEPNDRERAYLLLGEAYLMQSRYAQAREACQKVIEHNASNGNAYFIIAMCYASADCPGDGTPIARGARFWAAVDMLIKAKNVDESVADKCNSQIATYSQYFPSGDDLFTYGLKEGGSYSVSCWFTHNTTVRARK